MFVCAVTDFSAAEKDSGVKLCMLVRLLFGIASPILVNFGSPGVTAGALLPGCMHRGTEAKRRLPARLGGQSELRAAASRKAVWWHLRLAGLLTHFL